MYVDNGLERAFKHLSNAPTIVYGFNRDNALVLIQPIEQGLPNDMGITSFLLLDEEYHYDYACDKLEVGIRIVITILD